MSRIFISAAHKSSGKTTVSIGLCAALTQRDLAVQPFKKGPDYIDPMWLGRASNQACHNLDFYTMQRDEILATFESKSAAADISIIEGNKGLYDGLDLDGSNSNAALAKLLQSPIFLVLDARGMTRGIAPLILGYQAFDDEVNIAGIILNQLGGQRHEQKLRSVIEHYTNVQVIGAIYRNKDLEIPERHLGLIPAHESQQARNKINRLADIVKDQVDLDKVLDIASTAPPLPPSKNTYTLSSATPSSDLRIGIIHDAAFGFYYPGDLAALKQAGAELITIDSINDAQLPDIDGLFIGGGFPETHMQKLEANTNMRKSIADAINQGLPCYAECGGLMYLAKSIEWNGKKHQMVGVIPGHIIMHDKPQGRGYIKLKETQQTLWRINTDSDAVISAHEFHYSSLQGLPDKLPFAFEVLRGTGISGTNDGLVYKNLLACYAHLRDTEQCRWASKFVDFVRKRIL